MRTTRSVVGHWRRLAAAAAVSLSLVAAACTGSGSSDDGQDTPSGPVDQVTYMTGFGDTARENYARVAAEKGFFADANIEVTIQAGAGGDTNHTALAEGSVDFAVVDSSGAFTRYVNGEDDSFQVLAAIHQQWPMALLGYENQGIFAPRNLNNKTIGLATGTIAERLWPAYAAETPGLDPDTVEVVPTSNQTQVQQLVAGQLDAIALFSVSAASLEAAGGGRAVTALPWSDVFEDLYGSVLITTKDMAATNPDLVQRFTTALMQGLEYTLDHPEEAADILVEALPENNAEVATTEVTLLRDFSYAGLSGDQPLGFIDEDRKSVV